MRRTKQQSEQTRQRILAAARRAFARHGVTRTTLEHIAKIAGVTRGAIYWHFANKLALFQAMREQVSLPLVDRTDFVSLHDPDPLRAVEDFLRGIVHGIETDLATRQTFQITVLKCEYVDEFEPELKRQLQRCRELLPKLTLAYARAKLAGVLRADLKPEIAALETCAFTTGLFRLWLIDTAGTMVRDRVGELITAHVNGRRAGSVASSATAEQVAASTLH
jgi:TetR/AcrR family transcriptional regulator, acrAB operon repressor